MIVAAAVTYEDAWGDDDGESPLADKGCGCRAARSLCEHALLQWMRWRSRCAVHADVSRALVVICKHSNACVAPSRPQLAAEPIPVLQ